MSQAAFTATFADWKVIKTRGTVQLVFEIPIEKADEAYQVLGGMPIAAQERWCAIARLNQVPAPLVSCVSSSGERETVSDPVSPVGREHKQKRDWSAMRYSAQAALRCQDPIFRAFLREYCSVTDNSPEGAAGFIRKHCRIGSRADITPGTEAETYWQEIEDWFDAWKLKDRVMA